MASADEKPSFMLEIERVASRPTYASFKTSGAGEIAFDNAKKLPDIVRVRLIRVEGSRQTPIMEHAPVAAPRAAAAAPASRKTAKSHAPQHHSVTTKRASMAITGVLILLVIFLVLQHLSN